MKAIEESMDTCKILYIEDNPPDTKLIKELLVDTVNKHNNLGFEIASREKLKDGLNYLEQNTVDIILLDLSLPDSIGYRTFEKVKSVALNIPIIILTGSSLQRESLRQCLDCADCYLVKGNIDSHSLISAIKQTIQKTNVTKGSTNVNASIYPSTKGYTKDRFKSTWNLIQTQ